MKLARAVLLLFSVSVGVFAQVHVGETKPEPSVPFNMTTVANFELPWRIAVLPDGRMLVTEKIGPLWLVTPTGEKTVVGNTPPVYWEGQNGMLGVYLSPTYATDQNIYLTYVEPGDYGGGLAFARGRLNLNATGGGRGGGGPRSGKLGVARSVVPRGRGGEAGGKEG